MKIYAVSDIHTDISENMKHFEHLFYNNPEWIENKENRIIIVAGDISHDIGIIEKTLKLFTNHFQKVFYCPGNHELWCISSKIGQNINDQKNGNETKHDSVRKFEAIINLCHAIGVCTDPEILEIPCQSNINQSPTQQTKKVLICPLFSWYKMEFDVYEPTKEKDYMDLINCWSDLRMCSWDLTTLTQNNVSNSLSLLCNNGSSSNVNTSVNYSTKLEPSSISSSKTTTTTTTDSPILNMKQHSLISDYFTNLTEEKILKILGTCIDEDQKKMSKNIAKELEKHKFDQVITFSHFIPRLDLLPPRSLLKIKFLPKVVGDEKLESLIRQIGSNIHICGHTHIDHDKYIDGVRYIQHAFGYPRERKSWKAWKYQNGNQYEPMLVYEC